MAKLHLISLGCNKNLIDSEIMLEKLKNYEITQNLEEADLIIINTCGFIKDAKIESIDTILNAIKDKNKDAKLVVTGCLVQRYKDELIKEFKDEVDIFSGIGDFDKIDEIIKSNKNTFSSNTFLQTSQKRVISNSNYHAYIKISEGCNQTCSFCAIPSFKGKLKSREIKDIVDEIKYLIDQGFYDFSLIAQDSSSYGFDRGDKKALIKLIKEIEKIKGIRFARILYLYPTTISKELLDTIANSSVFLNYFDMPIQHISNNMLKIMKRGISKEKTIEILNYMKNLENSFLRTGIIVGHPGEDEEEFNELISFLNSFEFDRISVFAYSKEEGTASANMKNIDKKTINKRLKIVEKITNKQIEKSLDKLVGSEILVSLNGISQESDLFYSAKSVLWDKDIDGEILINDSDILNLEVGKTYLCKINQRSKDILLGKIIA